VLLRAVESSPKIQQVFLEDVAIRANALEPERESLASMFLAVLEHHLEDSVLVQE
jgi:hypothetical protein